MRQRRPTRCLQATIQAYQPAAAYPVTAAVKRAARLPVAMSPDGARQLMEQLRRRLEAAEVRRLEQRRKRLQQADEPTPW